MKLMLGGTPVKKMMIHNDTMDATMVASDMQAGVTAYANGQKITGTGKSFEFAYYGLLKTNQALYIPRDINVIEIASVDYPVQLSIAFSEMKNADFSSLLIGKIIVDGTEHNIVVTVANNILRFVCDKTVNLQVFYGKDNYV